MTSFDQIGAAFVPPHHLWFGVQLLPLVWLELARCARVLRQEPQDLIFPVFRLVWPIFSMFADHRMASIVDFPLRGRP